MSHALVTPEVTMPLRSPADRGSSSVRRRATRAAIAVLCLLVAACAEEPERDRVLILVVDGLRPDYVTAELMPRLNALADSGVRGIAHHAVFPTVTRVNGPTIFTGRMPGRHGLLGNSVYLPEVDATRALDLSSAADLRVIDQATGGQLLTAPSLGEMLAEQGLTYFAASSGSTGSGMLMNHRGAGAGLVHHELSIPDTLGSIVAALLGPVPRIAPGASSAPLVARAVDALLLVGLDRADADVMAGWLTEPDGTAHARGVGAPETLEVLAAVDAEIGRLLDGLETRGLLEHTNVLVVSDHGFSTHTGSTSVASLLVDAGLKESTRSTDVVVAGDGIHVRSGGEARVAAIVELLQRTEWVGPVFTRPSASDRTQGRIPGTLSFAAIGWNHVRSADILTSGAWTDAENEHGWRGEVLTPGVAGHGSASPWDIRATFIAAGPAIKRGVTSDIPTGNVDITPTALRLIGATVPEDLDGRVLEEILVGGPQPASLAGGADVLQTSTEVGGVLYELTAYRSRIGGSAYFGGTDVIRTRVEGQVAEPSTADPPRSRAASGP
jgi:predicted AlkP superfamily pyrophosphatase or phosphodiesterase